MVWSMLCVRIIEYMRLRGHSLRVYKGYIEYAFGLMRLWRYAFAFEGCVGNGMRLGNSFAFELFEGMVKVYGVCVYGYPYACVFWVCVGLMRYCP